MGGVRGRFTLTRRRCWWRRAPLVGPKAAGRVEWHRTANRDTKRQHRFGPVAPRATTAAHAEIGKHAKRVGMKDRLPRSRAGFRLMPAAWRLGWLRGYKACQSKTKRVGGRRFGGVPVAQRMNISQRGRTGNAIPVEIAIGLVRTWRHAVAQLEVGGFEPLSCLVRQIDQC